MKNYRIAFLFTAVLALAGCGGARIDGTLADAPSSQVVVRLLDGNRYKTLDTLKTNAAGHWTCRVDVRAGQPEFIYVFYKDTRIASLLLQKGERAKVVSDTLGNYSVTGSPETLKLMEVERDEARFASEFSATSARLDDLDPASAEAQGVSRELAKQYVAYYRSRVKYLMDNPYSLTVVPVLFQQVGVNLPVFSQATDAIHFRNAADSLKTVYPESRYVKALDEEARRRFNMMELGTLVQNAEQAGFPDLELPDQNGRKVKLSQVSGKVVMLYFWEAAQAEQKMFNLDKIIPLYERYHPKGLEIYAISLDADKSEWAAAVRNQQLPWVNVHDGSGISLRLYNVSSIPASYLIQDGNLVADATITDEASLKRYLDTVL